MDAADHLGRLLQQEPAREHIGNMIWRVILSMMLEISDFQPQYALFPGRGIIEPWIHWFSRMMNPAWNKLKKHCSPCRYVLKNTLLRTHFCSRVRCLKNCRDSGWEDRFDPFGSSFQRQFRGRDNHRFRPHCRHGQ